MLWLTEFVSGKRFGAIARRSLPLFLFFVGGHCLLGPNKNLSDLDGEVEFGEVRFGLVRLVSIFADLSFPCGPRSRGVDVRLWLMVARESGSVTGSKPVPAVF